LNPQETDFAHVFDGYLRVEVRQETRRAIVGIADDVKYASLIGDFEAAY
jgi:hypothetical protein